MMVLAHHIIASCNIIASTGHARVHNLCQRGTSSQLSVPCKTTAAAVVGPHDRAGAIRHIELYCLVVSCIGNRAQGGRKAKANVSSERSLCIFSAVSGSVHFCVKHAYSNQLSAPCIAIFRDVVQPTTETLASPRFAASRRVAGALDTASW